MKETKVKRKLKDQKAITLIALVITIIVLLILAAVSIATLTGDNGILKQANNAKIETRGGTVEEKIEIWKNEHYMNDYNQMNVKTEEEILQELKDQKLVFDDEIDTENKTITIGTRIISYEIGNVDKTAIKIKVNTGDDGEVILSINSDEEYIIDWGDGTPASKNEDSHMYAEKNKEFSVTITGKITEIGSRYDSSTLDLKYADKILEIEQWGETGLTYIHLSKCRNLRKIASPTQKSFKDITDFGSAFQGCTSLQNIPENLFANCPNVTDFGCAFCDCTSLQNIPENLFANCPNVTDFYSAFAGCTSLQNIPENLFANCSNVTNFMGTFAGCTSLQNIPENLFANCSNVEFFSDAFAGCTSLQNIPENLFANCPNVELFITTFKNCENLTGKAPVLWTRGTNTKENNYKGEPKGEGCFYNCTNLTNYSEIPEYWRNEPMTAE